MAQNKQGSTVMYSSAWITHTVVHIRIHPDHVKGFFFTISIQVYATDNQSTVMEMKVELFLWIHFSYYCTNLLFTGLLLFVYCKLSDLSSQLVSQLLVRDHLRTKQDAMLLDVQDMTS